ncbi:MAG: NAD(P)-dependent alcohol dehydrogenase [Fervidicoccaceae archaeon]
MRAAVLKKPMDRLYIEDVETPRPRGSEVLVRVRASGVCHTDLHIWEGHYGPIRVEERGVRFPLIMGHEIAGEVAEVGDQVEGFSKGDRVVVYPWIGDGTCKACLTGNENLCVRGTKPLGILRPGGYAEYVLVPSPRYLVRTNADLVKSAPMACAGITAYNAVKKAEPSPGDVIMIIGVGGLGHIGLQIARKLYGAQVIAVDVREEALKLAETLGADYAINPARADVQEEVKKITGGVGVDAAIDFVGVSDTFSKALASLKRGGRLIVVGLGGEYANIVLPLLPLRNIEIRGSYVGSLRDLVEMVRLVERGVINVEAETHKLEEINDVFERLRKGLVRGRAVITP